MTVTRNDVARAAGVSPAVVSYVTNEGSRPVAPATRERVQRAIDQLGYHPDPVARSMRTRKTSAVGLVLPDITQAYFARVTQALTNAARVEGLTLTVATSNGDPALERQSLAELARRRVDGAILMSIDPLQDFTWANELSIPILLVDRPAVATETAAAAVRHLADHGCRRIAHVTGRGDAGHDIRRKEGWAAAMRQAGLGDDEHRVVAEVDGSFEGGYQAGVALLSDRGTRPDGVVIDTPARALGFLRAAADLDVDVPGDLLVIAHEVGQLGPFTSPRLSSIDSIIEDVAVRSLRALRDLAGVRGMTPLDEHVGFELNLRESCGHP